MPRQAELEALFGVELDEDIREYIESTVSGMRDDVNDGAMEPADAVEDLLGSLSPMLVRSTVHVDARSANTCVSLLRASVLPERLSLRLQSVGRHKLHVGRMPQTCAVSQQICGDITNRSGYNFA